MHIINKYLKARPWPLAFALISRPKSSLDPGTTLVLSQINTNIQSPPTCGLSAMSDLHASTPSTLRPLHRLAPCPSYPGDINSSRCNKVSISRAVEKSRSILHAGQSRRRALGRGSTPGESTPPAYISLLRQLPAHQLPSTTPVHDVWPVARKWRLATTCHPDSRLCFGPHPCSNALRLPSLSLATALNSSNLLTYFWDLVLCRFALLFTSSSVAPQETGGRLLPRIMASCSSHISLSLPLYMWPFHASTKAPATRMATHLGTIQRWTSAWPCQTNYFGLDIGRTRIVLLSLDCLLRH